MRQMECAGSAWFWEPTMKVWYLEQRDDNDEPLAMVARGAINHPHKAQDGSSYPEVVFGSRCGGNLWVYSVKYDGGTVVGKDNELELAMERCIELLEIDSAS